MLLLVVWIAVGVLAVLVIAGLLHGLAGAFGRLDRELTAFGDEVRPVLASFQEAVNRAAATGSSSSPA